GRLAMNGAALGGVDRTHLIHGLADHVEHAPQRFFTHRDHHGLAQVGGLHAAHQAVGGRQRDGAHAALADVLCDLADDVDRVGDVESFAGNANCSTDYGNVSLGKLHVDGRSGHLNYFAFVHMQILFGSGMPDPYSNADAPLTISIISRVMLAWRTRFISS